MQLMTKLTGFSAKEWLPNCIEFLKVFLKRATTPVHMGWFWASNTVESGDLPIAVDPPNSLFHENIFGAFWAPRADIWAEKRNSLPAVNSNPTIGDISKCPIDHTKLSYFNRKPAAAGESGAKNSSTSSTGNTASSAGSISSASGNTVSPGNASSASTINVVDTSNHGTVNTSTSACPVDHTKFNELNNMPSLHSLKLPGQMTELPTERTISSIPRGGTAVDGFWEYPSPQQMLNAMVRKSGPDGIEEDAVESMVDVHNFLNEGVWEEVLQWEKPHTLQSDVTPRLLKFQGRPGDISPKARILQALAWAYPAKFGFPPPFDRHDWTVLRAVPGQTNEWRQVRYVIDFYEIPEGDGEMPTFTVDVRPAADSLTNIYDRARVAWGPVVRKALGWE